MPKTSVKKDSLPGKPVEVAWSTQINKIPKGKWKNITRVHKKRGVSTTVPIWERDVIWIVVKAKVEGEEQVYVTKSYWIPEENRFCMLTEDQEKAILAWAWYEPLKKGEASPTTPQELL